MASRGLLISCEMEAARRPTAASFSAWMRADSARLRLVRSRMKAAFSVLTPASSRMQVAPTRMGTRRPSRAMFTFS